MSALITAWTTKYALTRGVLKEKVEVDGASAWTVDDWRAYLRPGDWHRTEAAAIERAEEMRIAKLKSLDKQIKKISALKFGSAK